MNNWDSNYIYSINIRKRFVEKKIHAIFFFSTISLDNKQKHIKMIKKTFY